MKRQTIISRVTTLLFISIVLFSSACVNNNSSNSAETEVESKVKPPKMDLSTAVAMGNMEAIKQHIALGSDLNVKEPNMGSTPLITAAFFGHTQIAQALIEAGANLNIQNNEGSTALHTAAFFCRIEVVELLIAANADKSLKNIYNATAFESVAGPYEQVKPIYEQLKKDLKPIGLNIDLDYVEATRGKIAELLK